MSSPISINAPSNDVYNTAITGWFDVLKNSDGYILLGFIVGVVVVILFGGFVFINYTKIVKSKKTDLEASYENNSSLTLKAIQQITDEQQRVLETFMDSTNKAEERTERLFTVLSESIRHIREQSTRDADRLETAIRDLRGTLEDLNANFLQRPCGISYTNNKQS